MLADFWSTYWPELAAALTAALIGVIVAALWIRRRRIIKGARSAVTAAPEAARRRKAASAQAQHDRLVQAVLDRASFLKLRERREIVVKVSGQNPVVCTHHPTGREFYMFRDIESYRSATEGGGYNPLNSHWGRAPMPLPKWSDEKLRAWLLKYKDGVPEN